VSIFRSALVRKYLIPAAVFQSVLVGGGYGTGREIVEYFTRFGALGGLLGIGITVVCWSVVLAVTWEFARIFQVYDYRSFFRRLLGRGWVLFEILFILMFLMVLAVVASAAGEVLSERFSIPYGIGIGLMLALVGGLAFFGREIIQRSLAVWTVFLYGMFFLYFVVAFVRLGSEMGEVMTGWEAVQGWGVSGFKYAMYNLFIIPAILFSVRDLETRKETVVSAIVASVFCAAPALMFHLTFLADYPGILEREIPLFHMISMMGVAALLVIYLIALFGTFVETGAGLIQGTVERIDAYRRDMGGVPLTPVARGVLAVAAMGVAAALATLGIIRLIAAGYGTIAWGFFAVYVVPVLTIGVYQLRAHARNPESLKPQSQITEES
jgi:uncharacterized membrane protein YkvI